MIQWKRVISWKSLLQSNPAVVELRLRFKSFSKVQRNIFCLVLIQYVALVVHVAYVELTPHMCQMYHSYHICLGNSSESDVRSFRYSFGHAGCDTCAGASDNQAIS